MKRTLGFVAIPVTFCAGAFAARLLLQRAPASIAIDRAQPLLVVTAWANYGTHACAILLVTFVCGLGGLALTIRALESRPVPERRHDRQIVLAIAAASALACLAWPFIFSSDVYAYAAYGDLALRGLSPFATAPASLHDPLLDGARWQWSGTFPPCVYGTGFTLLAAALVRFAHAMSANAAVTLALFRFCGIVAFLATIACAFQARAGTRTIAIAALNPVVLWSVAEGHNDIYALLAVAVVAAFVRRGSDTRMLAFAVPLALCIKASAGLALVPFVLDPLFIRKRPFVPIVLATVAGIAIAVALDVPLLQGLRAHAAGQRFPTVSLGQAIGTTFALLVAGCLGIIALCGIRIRDRSGYAWLGLAAFAALPNPYPWYGVVFVILAAAAGKNTAAAGLYAVTICASLRYLPDAFGDMSAGTAEAISFVLVAPIAYALTGMPRDLRSTKERQTP